MNQLDSLKKISNIVVDSGNIEYIKQYQLQDVTTNPSLILQAINNKSYQSLFKNALIYAQKQGGNKDLQITNAIDKLTVNIGICILQYISGSISIEIDPRFSFNHKMSIIQAKKIINLYKEQNIDKSRILIKLAATWEGIKAAAQLEKENIHCNLTLVFSFAQARACAEAKVFLISPFVGRIYDWYHQKKPLIPYFVDEDPGIKSVKKIYRYYKKHCYKTIIMSASFRKIEQILALAGCDCLTISPNFLNKLLNTHQNVEQQLFPMNNKTFKQPIPISEPDFHWEHNKNAMAVEKLSEGIRLFALDQQKLKQILKREL
ncbi:transaldolase [Blochmannia endosymbiont of Camponotus (Colobopsis) obliquus]|uniref:transaldolase n=1 Tax=Blochmannia endosymbiont of Camponotus (Colobopsis) obliquus TaxID=1505597 RepID=UPI00061A7B10|nr:transaldolase [Blochmannia endosymbiont of Camponotus (Colobopsis) obliquus]AKC60662.1 transaldolase A [Blochmannia endosymbiont of Camponotus (Colobopsis) obliquus]